MYASFLKEVVEGRKEMVNCGRQKATFTPELKDKSDPL